MIKSGSDHVSFAAYKGRRIIPVYFPKDLALEDTPDYAQKVHKVLESIEDEYLQQ